MHEHHILPPSISLVMPLFSAEKRKCEIRTNLGARSIWNQKKEEIINWLGMPLLTAQSYLSFCFWPPLSLARGAACCVTIAVDAVGNKSLWSKCNSFSVCKQFDSVAGGQRRVDGASMPAPDGFIDCSDSPGHAFEWFFRFGSKLRGLMTFSKV